MSTPVSGLSRRARSYLTDAVHGLRRAPVEVLATFAAALSFSLALAIGDEAMQGWAEFGVSCALLLTVAWTGTMLNALGVWGSARRWGFTLAGGAAVAAYAIFVAKFDYEAEQWRAAFLLGAAALWIVALPAWGGAGDARVDRMRRVDGRVLLRIIGAGLYSAALFAGLALALGAVDVLFELKLDEQIYLHVWGWIAFALAPWIVLGGLPDYVRPAEQPNDVARVAQRIARYLVPPLLLLYFVILYAYAIRIVVQGEIPKNLVSPMVLAAGGLGALGLLLFDPRPKGDGVARWLRIAPALFLPLVPLGAWALVQRVQQYGWTEFRVIRIAALGVLALLALGATVQLVRRRSLSLQLVPLALCVLFLLAAIGPFNAMALSRRSQQSRLDAALTRVGVTAPAAARSGGTASETAGRTIPRREYEQIRSSAQYLAIHFGADALPEALRAARSDEDARWRDYAAALGLRPDAPLNEDRPTVGGGLAFDAPVGIQGGTAYRVQWTPQPRGSEPQTSPLRLVLRDSTSFAIHAPDGMFVADVGGLAAALRAGTSMAPRSGKIPADRAVVPVTDASGASRGQLLVMHLSVSSDSTGSRVSAMDGLLVLSR